MPVMNAIVPPETCAGSRPKARKIRGMEPPAMAPKNISNKREQPMTAPKNTLLLIKETTQMAMKETINPVAKPIFPSRKPRSKIFYCRIFPSQAV